MSNDTTTVMATTETKKDGTPSSKSEGTRLLLLNTAITIVIVLLTMLYYSFRVSHGSYGIGIMDVAEIYQNAQAKMATEYLKKETTDQQREQIKLEYQTFGKKLEDTINQIMNECNCIIVARDAVLTTNATDYTSLAKKRMGL